MSPDTVTEIKKSFLFHTVQAINKNLPCTAFFQFFPDVIVLSPRVSLFLQPGSVDYLFMFLPKKDYLYL